MGHKTEHQISVGNCQLTQCSCGRSALKVKDKVLLLSASQVDEIAGIFRFLDQKENSGVSALAAKLSGLSGGKKWVDFSAQM
jgi:hypothetical protein